MERQTSKPNSGTPLPIRLTDRVSRIDLRVADLPRLLYPVNPDKRVRTLSFFFRYLFPTPQGPFLQKPFTVSWQNPREVGGPVSPLQDALEMP